MMRKSMSIPVLRRRLVMAALALAVAGCSGGSGDQGQADSGQTSSVPAPAPPASTDKPVDASPDTAVPVAPPAVPPGDESDTPAGTTGVTGFHGFGPARFGDDAESVRIAWGRPMAFDRELEAGDVCRYLQPEPSASAGIAFMFEDDRFVRYDVGSPDFEAPGGGRVGQDRATLAGLYRDRHEIMPHKYIEGGHYLRVTGPDGSDSALVFELDTDGMATEWRIGVPPPVDYVEGCS